MDLTRFLIGIVILLISIKIIRRLFFSRSFPPGPMSFPLIGNSYMLMQKSLLKNLAESRKKWGPLFYSDFPLIPQIVMNDFDVIKQALNDPLFTGRPDAKFFSHIFNGKKGIFSSDGPVWMEQRRWALRHLRDFGFAKKSMSSMLEQEVADLLEMLQNEVGVPIDLEHKFYLSILNSIWYIISGQRYALDDPRLLELFSKISAVFGEVKVTPSHMLAILPLIFPWTEKIFKYIPERFRHSEYFQMVDSLNAFYLETIEEHKKALNDGEEPKDFIDCYLRKIQSTTDPNSSFYGKEGESQLLSVISNLFFAGSESTSNSLVWAMLYVMLNPHVQSKIQEEVDAVVGSGRLPSLGDKSKMPYTEATVLEVVRKSSIIAIGVTHNAMQDGQLLGYEVKKGEGITPNIYGIHHDKEFWGDPEVFRPERFLPFEETGALRERVIGFSTGKRVCIGEQLAKDELFLFITGILQRFNVREDPNAEERATEEHVFRINLKPKPFKVVLTERL